MTTAQSSVPAHCPGPDSANAGRSSACEGCPSQAACQSAPKGPDPDLPIIRERMQSIKHKVLVLSGKGGVGKSTFSSTLAFALAANERQVGLLDVDVCGPSIPKIVGVENESIHTTLSGWEPAFASENLSVMSVGFLLKQESDAIIWRGPKKNGIIKNFLRDVLWDQLDYLVIDTPPGTSDEHLSIAQYLKSGLLDGAILITTPQEVSLQDVRKEINFCKKVNIPILGVVENMSGFVCPSCKTETKIFAPSTGGAAKMCADLGLPFLGAIPLDPRIARSCDEGVSFVEKFPDSPSAKVYVDIIQKLTARLEAK